MSEMMPAQLPHSPMAGGARPSPTELAAAAGRTIGDVIAPALSVLFCGINPGLYSGWSGHHFARPGNRFWPVLHAAGFTPRRLFPWEERELLDYGCGITNLVARASATAAELTAAEMAAGGIILATKVAQFQPRVVAVLGVTAYRAAFARPKAGLGLQAESLSGAAVWVLPNPSGLNAHYTLAGLAQLFAEFRLTL